MAHSVPFGLRCGQTGAVGPVLGDQREVALLVGGMGLFLPSLIGFLMLMGLAAKNSILLVEYAIERERAGVSQRDLDTMFVDNPRRHFENAARHFAGR